MSTFRAMPTEAFEAAGLAVTTVPVVNCGPQDLLPDPELVQQVRALTARPLPNRAARRAATRRTR